MSQRAAVGVAPNRKIWYRQLTYFCNRKTINLTATIFNFDSVPLLSLQETDGNLSNDWVRVIKNKDGSDYEDS